MQNVKNLKSLLVAATILISMASSGLSATPEALSCGFVNSIQKSKSLGLKSFEEIFWTANESQKSAMVTALTALPEKLDEAQVVEVANVGGLFVEHFIVLNSSDIGNYYLRIIYERVEGGHAGVRFTMNGEAHASLQEWPPLQDPLAIKC